MPGIGWEDSAKEIEEVLKENLKGLYEKLRDEDSVFLKDIAQDMAKETYHMNTATNPEQKEEHRKNLDFLASTAYARGVRVGLKAMNAAEETAKQVLDRGLGILAGVLKKLVIP